jgi:hypothetical protein
LPWHGIELKMFTPLVDSCAVCRTKASYKQGDSRYSWHLHEGVHPPVPSQECTFGTQTHVLHSVSSAILSFYALWVSIFVHIGDILILTNEGGWSDVI